MTLRRTLASTLATLALAAGPAFAQSPPAPGQSAPAPAQNGPAPAPAQTPAPDVPAPSCKKPEELGRYAGEMRKKTWNNEVRAYIDCMKKYIDEQRAIANAHTVAGNSAIERLNGEINDFNEQAKRASGS